MEENSHIWRSWASQTMEVKVSPLKRKLPSTNREAVRKRLKNLENNPDFKVLLAKALEKANGGVECKECLVEVRKRNECLVREVELSRDYIKPLKERIQERKLCDERASLFKKQLALLEDSNNSLWAHNKKYREEILLLRQKKGVDRKSQPMRMAHPLYRSYR